MAAPAKWTMSSTGFARKRSFLAVGEVLLVVAAVGCNQRAGKEPVKTQPSEQRGQPSSAPQQPQPAPQAQPESKPSVPAAASQPARPQSTYSSRPPYPVSLFVTSPDEEQPGWLKIEKLADDKEMATAKGHFPEQNRIYVDSSNVRTIRIHVGHLPLAPNERVILEIDHQGMVLSRKSPFVTLTRQPTGEWVPEKEKK